MMVAHWWEKVVDECASKTRVICDGQRRPSLATLKASRISLGIRHVNTVTYIMQYGRHFETIAALVACL